MAFILFRKSSRLGSDPSGFADAGDGAEGIDAYPNHQPLKSLERGNIFVATADMGVTVQSRWMIGLECPCRSGQPCRVCAALQVISTDQGLVSPSAMEILSLPLKSGKGLTTAKPTMKANAGGAGSKAMARGERFVKRDASKVGGPVSLEGSIPTAGPVYNSRRRSRNRRG